MSLSLAQQNFTTAYHHDLSLPNIWLKCCISVTGVAGAATPRSNDKALKCWWEPATAAYINKQGSKNTLFKKNAQTVTSKVVLHGWHCNTFLHFLQLHHASPWVFVLLPACNWFWTLSPVLQQALTHVGEEREKERWGSAARPFDSQVGEGWAGGIWEQRVEVMEGKKYPSMPLIACS